MTNLKKTVVVIDVMMKKGTVKVFIAVSNYPRTCLSSPSLQADWFWPVDQFNCNN